MNDAPKYRVVRDLTVDETTHGLPLAKGTVLYECVRPTYGCIEIGGKAMTLKEDGDYPFFEVHGKDVEKIP